MITRLTTTTWSTNVVFVVLAGLLLLAPAAMVQAVDVGTLDPSSPAQNPPGGGVITNTNNPGNPNAPGYFGDPTPVIGVNTDTPGQTFQESLDVIDADGNVATFTTGGSAGGSGDDIIGGEGGTNSVAGGVGDDQLENNFFGEASLKSFLYNIVVNLFGTLVGWAGQILNFAINDFVIGFGEFFNTTGVGVAVNALWSLVRDFFNILFIFGFIWIGFQMILDSGNSRAKQTLVSLIMAALLVNFSLFVSKFVVDFSNRLASEIAIAAFPTFDAPVSDIDVNIRTQRVNVADTFFAHMGIPQTLGVDEQVMNNEAAPWSYIFGSAIFYLVAAFVFASGGIMLIIRFVALTIFMVLSPFMFLGWVFPGMQGWTDKYWKGFLGRAFYAPVYIILLFFAGTILQSFFGDNGSMTNNFVLGIQENGQVSSLSSILGAFILSCAFLIAAVQVAGKMSADGAGGVMKVGSNIVRGGQRRLKNGAIGVGRFGVRNTAGYAAQGLNYAARKDVEAHQNRMARMSQGNAVQRWGARTIDRTYGSAIRAGERATIAGSETLDQKDKRVGEQNAKFNTYRNEADRTKDLEKEKTNFDNADTTTEAGRKDRTDALSKLAGVVGKMSDDELKKLDLKTLKHPSIAANLSEAQIKMLADSGIYTNDQVKGLKDQRERATIDEVTTAFEASGAAATELNSNFERLSQTIKNMNGDRKASLLSSALGDVNKGIAGADKRLEKIAFNLSDKDIESLEQSGKVGASQIQTIKDARKTAVTNIASGAVDTYASGSHPNEKETFVKERRQALFKNSAQDAGKLPPEIYSEPKMARYITPAALNQRINNGLTSQEITNIQSNIATLKTILPAEYKKWISWSNTPAARGSGFNDFT